MFSLIYAWINDCVNNREADDLRRHRAHYDVIVMQVYVGDMSGYVFDIAILLYTDKGITAVTFVLF